MKAGLRPAEPRGVERHGTETHGPGPVHRQEQACVIQSAAVEQERLHASSTRNARVHVHLEGCAGLGHIGVGQFSEVERLFVQGKAGPAGAPAVDDVPCAGYLRPLSVGVRGDEKVTSHCRAGDLVVPFEPRVPDAKPMGEPRPLPVPVRAAVSREVGRILDGFREQIFPPELDPARLSGAVQTGAIQVLARQPPARARPRDGALPRPFVPRTFAPCGGLEPDSAGADTEPNLGRSPMRLCRAPYRRSVLDWVPPQDAGEDHSPAWAA